jgi:large exoprotein involved in heme utilization and adhesion
VDVEVESRLFASTSAGSIGATVNGDVGNGGMIEGSPRADSNGGAITLETNVSTGTVDTNSDINLGTIEVGFLSASADANANANASADAGGEGATVNGNVGNGGMIEGSPRADSNGGAITLETNVSTGTIDTNSDVNLGTIEHSSFDTHADAFAISDVDSFIYTSSNETITGSVGNGGNVIGFPVATSEGGAISLSTDILTESIDTTSNVNLGTTEARLTANFFDAFASASAGVAASATIRDPNVSSPVRNGGGNVTGSPRAISRGGDINLSTDIATGAIDLNSDFGDITINGFSRLMSYSRALASVDTGNGGSQDQGVRFEATGGEIEVSSFGEISLSDESELNASANAFSYIETIVGSRDVIELQGGTIQLVADRNIILNDVLAESKAPETPFGFNVNRLANQAGNLIVRTPSLAEIYPEAQISVNTLGGQGNAGNIEIVADSLLLQDGSNVSATTDSGNAGNINLNLRELLLGRGSSISTNVVRTQGGNAGNIRIVANSLFFRNGSRISATTEFGAGGSIELNLQDQLTVGRGNSISTSAGRGTAGSIGISAESVLLRDGGDLSSTINSGTGGSIALNLQDQLSIERGSSISTSAGRGTAGSIGISAESVLLRDGGDLSSTINSGTGGSIALNLQDQLSIERGSSISTSAGRGTAGDIDISANSSFLQNESELSSTTESGNGGNIILNLSNRFVLQNRSSISTSAGRGTAGDIDISANSSFLQNESELSSTTESGNGGNIDLRLDDSLELTGGSRISTSAGTVGSGGDGGNISIEVSNGFILAPVPESNSDITANAFEGRGGRIEISTPGLFGLILQRPQAVESLLEGIDPDQVNPNNLVRGVFGFSFRSREDLARLDPDDLDPANIPTNDITAISQTNPSLSGTIVFNTLDLDPSRGLEELPSTVVDGSNLVSQSCQPGESVAQTRGEFFVTGRGGLPTSPTDALDANPVLDDLGDDGSSSDTTTEPVTNPSASNPNDSSAEVVEAQGWMTDADGNVVLVADAATTTPHDEWEAPLTCAAATPPSP